MPVTSYAAEMLLLFQVAAQGEILIELKDRKKAIHLRARLNKLRRDMRLERHPSVTIANGVELSITPEGNIRAYPADTQYLTAIRKAGVTIEQPGRGYAVPQAQSKTQSPLPPARGIEIEEMAGVLNEFFKGE